MNTFREKVASVIDKIKSSKKLSLLAIILLIAAIPLTVFIAQTAQDVRQRASTNQATITINPTTTKPGDSISVQWTIQQPNSTISAFPTAIPSPVAPLAFVFSGESNAGGYGSNESAIDDELTPTSTIKILNNSSFLFEDLDIGTNNTIDHWNGPTSSTHGFELGLADLVKAHAFPNNPQVYLVKTGQGNSFISQWNSNSTFWQKFVQRTAAAKTQLPASLQWIVLISLGINDNNINTSPNAFKAGMIGYINKIKADLPGAMIIMTQFQSMGSPRNGYDSVMQEIATSEPNVYVIDTTNAPNDGSHWSYEGNKVVAKKMIDITKNALGNVTPSPSPSATPSGIPKPILTGAETLQLFRVEPTNTYSTGPKMYLNCQNKTDENIVHLPPLSPIYIGQCSYAIPKETKPDTYLIRMLAADGTTILGESSPITVTNSDLTTGLVSYWSMNETSNTILKDSIGTNDAIASGTAIVDGKIQKARSFTLNTDKVESPPKDLGLTALSIGAWIFPTGTNSAMNETIIRKQKGAALSWGLTIYGPQNQLQFGWINPGQCTEHPIQISNASLSLNQWHYVVATKDASGAATLYIDGSVAPSASKSSTQSQLTCDNGIAPITIGNAANDSTVNFLGTIDEVGLWNRALSPEEIKVLASGQIPPFEQISPPLPSNAFNVTTSLTGIGKTTGNPSPKHPTREAIMTVFDAQNNLVSSHFGKLSYDEKYGEFKGIFDQFYPCLPNTSCNYTVKIQTPQFLRKQLPGIISIKPEATIDLPAITLTTGDINDDNKINILDYNFIVSCYGNKIDSQTCKTTPQFVDGNAPLSDLNDDGVVDGIDYNLFIRSLATKEGD